SINKEIPLIPERFGAFETGDEIISYKYCRKLNDRRNGSLKIEKEKSCKQKHSNSDKRNSHFLAQWPFRFVYKISHSPTQSEGGAIVQIYHPALTAQQIMIEQKTKNSSNKKIKKGFRHIQINFFNFTRGQNYDIL